MVFFPMTRPCSPGLIFPIIYAIKEAIRLNVKRKQVATSKTASLEPRLTGLFRRFNEPVITLASLREWLDRFEAGDRPAALTLLESIAYHFTGIHSAIINYDLERGAGTQIRRTPRRKPASSREAPSAG
jgi:hypothetical protein